MGRRLFNLDRDDCPSWPQYVAENANFIFYATRRILRKHVDDVRTHPTASWLKRFRCSLTVIRLEFDHDGLFFGHRDYERKAQVFNPRQA
jgi:hypothetical protein